MYIFPFRHIQTSPQRQVKNEISIPITIIFIKHCSGDTRLYTYMQVYERRGMKVQLLLCAYDIIVYLENIRE